MTTFKIENIPVYDDSNDDMNIIRNIIQMNNQEDAYTYGIEIPGNDDNLFYKIAKSVNEAIEKLDPAIGVISEPGRYYVNSAFTLATFIQSKRIVINGMITKRCYYINDGIFGSFLNKVINALLRVPIPLCNVSED